MVYIQQTRQLKKEKKTLAKRDNVSHLWNLMYFSSTDTEQGPFSFFSHSSLELNSFGLLMSIHLWLGITGMTNWELKPKSQFSKKWGLAKSFSRLPSWQQSLDQLFLPIQCSSHTLSQEHTLLSLLSLINWHSGVIFNVFPLKPPP